MQEELKSYLQKTVNMDHDELVEYTKAAMNNLIDKLIPFLTQEEACAVVLRVICCTVSADKQFSEKEQQFFEDALGADKTKALMAIRAAGDDEARRGIFILSGKDKAVKTSVFMLASSVAAADERINADELSFLDDIFNA